MSVVANNIIAGASGQGGSDYEISRSIRFNSSDSSDLRKTPGAAGNSRTFTISFWVKRSQLGAYQRILATYPPQEYIRFDNDDTLRVFESFATLRTTQVFRDPNSFYHIVIAADSTQTTASNRLKLYVNGTQVTQFSTATYPSQNATCHFNKAVPHQIGSGTVEYFNGLIADLHLVDGQQLLPSEFGQFDNNNVWQAKEYKGTYGWFDNSQSWSSSVTGTNVAGSYPVVNAFDGSLSTLAGANAGTALTLNFGSLFSSTAVALEVFSGSSRQISVDGTAKGTAPSGTGWVDCGTLSFTTITSGQASNGGGAIWAIKVNGKFLIDSSVSVADNSYHLKFDDNSSNDALGASSSPNNTTLPGVDFDGNDALTVSPGSDWAFGTGDFTVEAFVYHRSSNPGSNYEYIIDGRNSSQTSGPWAISYGYTGGTNLQFASTSGLAVGSSVTPPIGKWYHLAVARSGTTIKMFIDGAEVGSATNSTNFSVSPTTSYIGRRYTVQTHLNGVISNLRVVKGTALYTSAFTVPTAPLTNVNNTVMLICQSNSSVTAATVGSGTITAIGNPTAVTFSDGTWTVNNMTAESPTSLTGVDFDGNDRLTVPSFTSAPQGTSDWTIEFYAYFAAWSGNKTVTWAAETSHPNYRIAIQVESGKYYIVDGGNYGSSWYSSKNDSSSYTSVVAPLKEWHHVAIQRASGVDTIYIDGQVQFTASGHTGSSASVTGNWIIGGGQSGSTDMVGKLSNFRVLSGTALYSSTFTPPTTPLTNITNTVLLCCQSNSSATAAAVSPGTLTTTGDPTAVTFSDSTEANDCLVDTPTNFGEDTGVGGSIRGNFATLNLFDYNTSGTLSDGNLRYANTGNAHYLVRSNFPMKTGKWYCEAVVVANGSTVGSCVGIATKSAPNNLYVGYSNGYGYHFNGNKYTNGSSASFGTAYGATVGNVVGLAFDADAGKLEAYLNGVLQGTIIDNLTSDDYYFAASAYNSTWAFNFGARSFTYPAPSGYNEICTTNMPESTIKDGSAHMDVKLFTANNSTQTISGLGFSPDLVWTKSRANAYNHELVDTVRGSNKVLFSNLTNAEVTDANRVTGFNSDGFGLGANSNSNLSGTSLAWAWNAGSSNTSVSAGDRNSSAYYISATYSDTMTTDDSGGFPSSYPKTFAFNNNINSNTFVGNQGSTITWNASSYGITVANQVRVRIYNKYSLTVTTSTGSQTLTNSSGIGSIFGWVDFTISGTLQSITSGGAGNAFSPNIAAIEIDGRPVVDSGVSVTNVPSIASTVRANADAGFSIVKWVSNGSNQTVAHGLNTTPAFIILRQYSGAENWAVYHKDMGGSNGYLQLNSTLAFTTNAAPFNSTDPTSSVFSYNNTSIGGGNGNNVLAYCFAPVEGYSAMGKYTGNGSNDGSYVHTGFKIKWLLIKNITSARYWRVWDTERDPYNLSQNAVSPDANLAEYTTNNQIDILSNGFKLRTSNDQNVSGHQHIYVAFADNPFSSNGGIAR